MLSQKISSKVDFMSITTDNKSHVSSFFVQLLFQWLIVPLISMFLLSLHCGNSVNRVFTKVNSDHDLPVREKMVTNYSQAWFKRRILHAPNQILILVDSNEYIRLI